MKIMFICTGNICRSAMAEGIARKIAEEDGLDVEAYSCGLYANTGDYATYNAVEAVKYYDVDISEHRATNIRDSKIEEMDLILCATENHKNMVISMYPDLVSKVFTMKEYAETGEENMDIKDPWGYDMDVYTKCAKEIYEIANKILEKG